MDFEQALSTIISRFGVTILCDGKKFMALLFDLAPSLQKEKKIIRALVSENKLQRIYDINKFDKTYRADQITALFNELTKEMGMSDEWANIAIEGFSNVLKWDMRIPSATISVKAEPQITSQMTLSNYDSLMELFIYKTDIPEVNIVIDMISSLDTPVTIDKKNLFDQANNMFEALDNKYKDQLPELKEYLNFLNNMFDASVLCGRLLSRSWTISRNDFEEFRSFKNLGTFNIFSDNGSSETGYQLLSFSKDNKNFLIYATEADYSHYTVFCVRNVKGQLHVITDDVERDLAQFVVEENLKCLGECSYTRNYDPSFDINALKKRVEQMI